jgi:hypothetical protein
MPQMGSPGFVAVRPGAATMRYAPLAFAPHEYLMTLPAAPPIPGHNADAIGSVTLKSAVRMLSGRDRPDA